MSFSSSCSRSRESVACAEDEEGRQKSYSLGLPPAAKLAMFSEAPSLRTTFHLEISLPFKREGRAALHQLD